MCENIKSYEKPLVTLRSGTIALCSNHARCARCGEVLDQDDFSVGDGLCYVCRSLGGGND